MNQINAHSNYFYWPEERVYDLIEKKIESFSDLTVGWSFGEGEPLKAEVVGKALELNRHIKDTLVCPTNAFPGVDGSIMVTAYDNDDYLEFVIEESGTVVFCHEKKEQELVADKEMSFEQGKLKVNSFRKEKWSSSVLSMPDILTTRSRDLQAKPLPTPLEEGGYRLYTNNALCKVTEEFAITLENFTPLSQGTQ